MGEAKIGSSFFATKRQIRSFLNISFQRGKEAAQAHLANWSHTAGSSKWKFVTPKTEKHFGCASPIGSEVGLGTTAASKILAPGVAHKLNSAADCMAHPFLAWEQLCCKSKAQQHIACSLPIGVTKVTPPIQNSI